MKRILDLSKELVTFEGKPVMNGESKLTLKDVLMSYVRNSQEMGLSESDISTCYVLGFLFAHGDKKTELTTDQYDCIKRVCDNGKMKVKGQDEQYMWGLEVRLQVKEMIDKATPIEEPTKK